MGKTESVRLPSVNKGLFDKINWQALAAVVKYIEDLTVWVDTTLVKGEDNKKCNGACSGSFVATAKETADVTKWIWTAPPLVARPGTPEAPGSKALPQWTLNLKAYAHTCRQTKEK